MIFRFVFCYILPTFVPLCLFAQIDISTIVDMNFEDTNGNSNTTPAEVNETFDISNCTSVQFTMDFSFNFPWEGGGEFNLEYCDEPGISANNCFSSTEPCNCDPFYSGGDDGCNCWDFLYVEFAINGGVVFSDMIGDVGTTDADQISSHDSGVVCTDGSTSATILIRTQLGAAGEELDISNVSLLCWQGKPTINTLSQTCANENLTLVGDAINPNDVHSYMWTALGATIDDNDSNNTFASNVADNETFSLVITDNSSSSCTAEVSTVASILASPDITWDEIDDLCPSDLNNVNLTLYNNNVGVGSVTWWNGDPLTSGVQLPQPETNIDLTSIGDLWVQLEDGNGCFDWQLVTITPLFPPIVTVVSTDTEFCLDEQIYLEVTTDPNYSYSWNTPTVPYTTNPLIISNATLADAGLYEVTVTDINNNCTTSASVIVQVFLNPIVNINVNGESIISIPEFCQGDLITFTEDSGNVDITDWSWYQGADASGALLSATNPFDLTNSALTTDSGIYSLEIEDSNQCTDIINFEILIHPEPTANLFVINACNEDLLEYNLDFDANPNINTTELINWFETDPTLGGATQITPTNLVDLTTYLTGGIGSIWAEVVDGTTQCTNVIEIDITQIPPPTADPFLINECTLVLMDFDLDTDANPNINSTESINWYETDPNLGGATQITPTNSVDLTNYLTAGIGSIWAEVVDGTTGCTNVIEVAISEVEAPTGCISGDLNVCEDGCTEFTIDLSGGSGSYLVDVEFSFLGLGPFGPISIAGLGLSSTFNLCVDNSTSNIGLNGNTLTLPSCVPLIGTPCLQDNDLIEVGLLNIVDTGTGCLGTVEPTCDGWTLVYNELPIANTFILNGCAIDFEAYDLNGMHASQVNPSVPSVNITWWNSQPSLGGAIEYDGDNADLSTATALWVQVEDPITGCTNEIDISLNFSTAPEVIVSGGATLCIGGCTSGSENFTFTIVGGVGPFLVGFDVVSDGGASNSFTYSGITFPGASFGVCISTDGPPFSICNPPACNPPIVRFNTGNSTTNTIQITSITDTSNGCSGIIGDPSSASYAVSPLVDINDLDTEFECVAGGVFTFDLTTFESDIVNIPNLTIDWFESDCVTPINNPSSFSVSTSTIVCYVATNSDGCQEIGNLELAVEEESQFDTPNDTVVCLVNGVGFTIPAIEGSLVTVTSQYYDGPLGSGNGYSVGDIINTPTTLYIFDPLNPNCSDQDSFDIDIILQPEITFPADGQVFSDCNQFILPAINVNNLMPSGTSNYYTGPNASGMILNSGDPILQNTTLYVYAINDTGCYDEVSFSISLDSSIEYELEDVASENCNCVTLPPIQNGSGTTFYYTMLDGNGVEYAAQDQICDAGFYTFYVYDQLADQTCITNPNISLSFTITDNITLNTIDNIEACSEFELPNINGNNLNNPTYNTQPDGSGVQYFAGKSVSTNLTLYAIDQINGCDIVSEDFNIAITDPFISSPDTTINICQGYNQGIDLTPLITGDQCGTWDNGGLNAVFLGMPMNVNVSGLGIGSVPIYYSCQNTPCPELVMTVNLNVIDPPILEILTDTLSLCIGELDTIPLDTLLINVSSGSDYIDDWIRITPSTAPFDVDSVSIVPNDYTAGIYAFEYTISNVSVDYCNPKIDTAYIEIVEEVSAGPDIFGIGACIGDEVNLNDFVTAGGTFSDDNTTGNLSDGMFTTTGLLPGTYNFTYSIAANGSCEADTAALSVDLTSNLSAGIDTITQYCQGSEISLFNALSIDANSGGLFFDLFDNGINPNMYIVGASDEVLQYKIGGQGSCSLDSALITISPLPVPTFSASVGNEYCSNTCSEYEVLVSNGTNFNYTFELLDDFGNVIEIFNDNSLDGSVVLFDICNADQATSFSNDTLYLDVNGPSNYSLLLSNFDNNECAGAIGLQWPLAVFGNTTREITGDYCPESNFSIMVEGTIYDINNQSGTEIKSNSGSTCDSMIVINLNFYEEALNDYQTTTCIGQAVALGGEMIADSDGNGVESGNIMLAGQSSNGCDSTINYIINYEDAAFGSPITTTHCSSDIVPINGVDYTASNPMGMDTIVGGSAGGCDSIIIVDLNFISDPMGIYTDEICSDGSIMIFGQVFDASNLNGQAMLQGGSLDGCDTVVNVSLSIITVMQGTSTPPAICKGDTLTLGDSQFYEGNESGVATLAGASAMGCDSTVAVSISFLDTPERTIARDLCAGATFEYEGVIFDQNNLSGSVTVESDGITCDSLISVEITILDTPMRTINREICVEDNFEFNGSVFDLSNPTGEVIVAGDGITCDSLITINLTFMDVPTRVVPFEICPGEEVVLYGITMSESNLSQDVNATGMNTECDSIITLSGTLLEPGIGTVTMNLCENDSLIVGTDTYDINNPEGQSSLFMSSLNGCDSLVNVSLSFSLNTTFNYIDTLCGADEVIINGVTYSTDNPSGTEILFGQNTNGCDSIVNVSIFSDFEFSYNTLEPCPEEVTASIIIENVTGGSGNYELIADAQTIVFTDNELPLTFDYPVGEAITFSISDLITNCEDIVTNGNPIQSSSSDDIEIVANDNGFNTYTLSVDSDNTTITSFEWITTGQINCTDCETPEIFITENTDVIVNVGYGNGCNLSDTLSLEVEVKEVIFIPNIFNPEDSDPLVNTFYIQSTNENDMVSKMNIFDRWGNLVFQSLNSPVNDPSFGWNGKTYDSTSVEQGVYIFVAEISKENGDVELVTGDVTIVR